MLTTLVIDISTIKNDLYHPFIASILDCYSSRIGVWILSRIRFG
jgi:hypothetical protein